MQIEIKEKNIDAEKSSRINYLQKNQRKNIYANRIKNKIKIIQIEMKEIICL